MMRIPFATRGFVATALLFLVLLGACAGPTKKAESVQRVDDLLAHIECVQVDSTVCKELTHAAHDQLSELCSPSFVGDAKEAYEQLLARIDASEKQARRLRESIEPMRIAADEMFRQWTADLGAFGNSRMRQRSQTRLDDTQTRYRNVFATAQSILIGHDAFNADLRDSALFLSHDMNAAAVSELADDVRVLAEVLVDLDGRVDACAAACRAYVESAAIHGQVDVATGAAEEPDPEAQAPESPPADSKRKSSTLKRRPASPARPAAEPVQEIPPSDGPVGPPVPAPEPPGQRPS